MAGFAERIEAAARACAEAIDALDERVHVPLPLDAGRMEAWDRERSVAAVERVTTAFDELGPLESWAEGLAAGEAEELRAGLMGLARLHALLVFSVAREKDALRDRLLLSGTAARAGRWHEDPAPGDRCNVSG